ncbi:chemosensory receptor B [Elysia marginata]|uniref:Chemosensory receptor B n=1 Tax=Elysia marginata TaxID=1093978 RepID=A0AAV4IWA9_9GAST|nr:chemosensory receptor B [Elysia marginata]
MKPLVSYHIYTIVMFVLGVSATNVVALFGVFSNTANILVYYKMGLQETTNISFFTLAINDLMASVATIIVEICQSPMMKINELPRKASVLQAMYLASFIVYHCCGFGAFTTALLASERCLCIVLPLRVGDT